MKTILVFAAIALAVSFCMALLALDWLVEKLMRRRERNVMTDRDRAMHRWGMSPFRGTKNRFLS